MTTFWRVCAALFVVLALGIVGGMDAEEAERQEVEYCDKVSRGIWPDYDGDYAQRCPRPQRSL